MSNINDDDIDLGLTLCCTTRDVEEKPKDDSGAGVNASATVDMAFAASDPLSELVWSPHKGLWLKCADSGLADKKPFLLWNVGPSNLIASPSQGGSFKGTYDDEHAINETIIISQQRFQADVMGTKSGNEFGCSSKVEIADAADGVDMLDSNRDAKNVETAEKDYCITQDIRKAAESCENRAGQVDLRTERSLLHGANSKVNMEATEPLAGKINQEISTEDKYRDGDVLGSSRALSPTVKDSEAPACLVPISPTKNQADQIVESTSLPELEKLECIAENDVNLAGIKETCDQNDEQLIRDSSVPPEASPTHSRSSSYRRKGKGKATSEGNANSKMSNGEEDSHESVESCNSTWIIPKGKKRWNFEQQAFVGSKRIRKNLHGDSAAESPAARNSSFMTWISNMVKGFSKSSLEESPTLALPFTPNNEKRQGKETNHQKIVIYDKDRDSSCRSMGFQSVFQSLYSPTLKVAETEIAKEDHPMGEPKVLPSAEKLLIDVPPISCHRGDDVSEAHMLNYNNKISQSTAAHKEVPLLQIQMPPVVSPQDASRTASAENKASSGIACTKPKDGLSSPDSMSRPRTTTGEDKNTCHSSEYDVSNRNQSLRSLWITRFSGKTPGTVLNIDNSKPVTVHETLTCSAECRRPLPQAQTSMECQIEPESSVAKETSAGAKDGDVSASSKEIHDNNYERSMNNLYPIIPSANFKKSEALASLFARRLDALKHIAPSSKGSEYSYTRTTCFFCGRSGHDLRNCSEVTESELEVIIRNIRAYDGAEESTCLCIRCFKLDHWAISCPTSYSNRLRQLDRNVSAVNQNKNDPMQLFTGNECSSSLFEIKQGHSIELTNHAHHSIKQLWFGKTCRSNQVQNQRTSDPVENRLKESITSSNLMSKEIADVPGGIFDVIRGLRLSRVDILKWMNSNTSLSHLEGFFLRLRLGKLEAGLGGTGYYVACITGLKGENAERDSKNCISVNVCGVKCFVGSQYVSNQDFLEDELTTWWRKTLESGGKVPTKEDLTLKLEERMKLGF